MGYQENREKRIAIFEDTLRYCERNRRLLKSIERTRQDTILYREPLRECNDIVRERYEEPARISVSQKRTLEAAGCLHGQYSDCRVGVLNFASATNPGGGVIRGSNAQEESLCRCSTLHPCLNTEDLVQEYYIWHKKRRTPLYSDSCIFTPGIMVFKTDSEWPVLFTEENWFLVDVISCAAPNLRTGLLRSKDVANSVGDTDIRILLQKRIRGILQVAVRQQIDILVLGAFGCGAFCNSPNMVAEVFRDALKEFQYAFREVHFAVYCRPADTSNYDIFADILNNCET